MKEIDRLKKYITAENSTHWLKCRHCVSARSCRDYVMHCLILSKMPNNRLKILVFGERDWKLNEFPNVMKIRYVDANRVYPKTQS
jgi:hypothetical protein